MNKLELAKRYALYIFGLYVFSFGIALVARSTMGATLWQGQRRKRREEHRS